LINYENHVNIKQLDCLSKNASDWIFNPSLQTCLSHQKFQPKSHLIFSFSSSNFTFKICFGLIKHDVRVRNREIWLQKLAWTHFNFFCEPIDAQNHNINLIFCQKQILSTAESVLNRDHVIFLPNLQGDKLSIFIISLVFNLSEMTRKNSVLTDLMSTGNFYMVVDFIKSQWRYEGLCTLRWS